MIEIGFRYIVCFVELNISYILLENFLESKSKKRYFREITATASAIPLLVVNTLQLDFLVNGLTTFILLYFGSLFLHSAKFTKRLFLILISISIGFLAEVIAAFGGSALLPQGYESYIEYRTYYILLVIISKLIQFAVVKIIIALIPNKFRKIEIRETRALLFCPILSIVTLYLLNYLDIGRPTHTIEHIAIIIVSLGWLVLNLILMRIYYTALEKYDLKNQLQITELRAQAEVDFFRQQKSNEETLRRMMHDVKNQLINAWAIAEECPAVKDYLQELIGVYDFSGHLSITTDYKNKVLNFILNRYIMQCRQLGIPLDIQINHFDFSFLSLSDTSRILDNAFENAIAACLKVDDRLRFIAFHAYSQNGILYMTLRNSKAGELNIQDGIPLTSKANVPEHGFGFQNIRQAAQAYDGSATFEVTENEFILIVTLNTGQPTT